MAHIVARISNKYVLTSVLQASLHHTTGKRQGMPLLRAPLLMHACQTKRKAHQQGLLQ
jgi:hypothetical protein